MSSSLRRFLTLFLLSLALPSVANAQNISVAAESYILLDATTGTVLAEENADLRLPPASLTKIMSSYLFFQAVQDGVLSLEQPITISENAWGAQVVGSKMFIEVGKQVSVADLLRGVVVQSGNDASIALAEAVSGAEEIFAEEMNRRAAQLGLTNSHFKNATGLPEEEHYSSARDIAFLSQALILNFPDLYPLYAEREFTYNEIRQENRNGLLSEFTGADGIKTGYTKAAGYCLAASASQQGRRLIAVVMKTKSTRVRESETKKLLTYGFNHFNNITLFSRNDQRTLPVWSGAATEVSVQPASDGVYTLPRSEKVSVQYFPHPQVTAPVAAGDVLGELQVIVNDKTIDRVNVVAAEAVAAGSRWTQLEDFIKINWLGHGNNETVLSQW
ncbi:MAG: D-alanyl-D-alanine carboxypeptidase [Proteobacteria bacterium]|nr:D-alanyl-D-alanine carboxypeptidase [Pseudomonadota bacterium]